MQPIGTHIVVWFVCVYVMWMIPAKTAEPITMPFGTWARVDPNNHVLDGGPDPLMEQFWGVDIHGHARGWYIQQDDVAFYQITSVFCVYFNATSCM